MDISTAESRVFEEEDQMISLLQDDSENEDENATPSQILEKERKQVECTILWEMRLNSPSKQDLVIVEETKNDENEESQSPKIKKRPMRLMSLSDDEGDQVQQEPSQEVQEPVIEIHKKKLMTLCDSDSSENEEKETKVPTKTGILGNLGLSDSGTNSSKSSKSSTSNERKKKFSKKKSSSKGILSSLNLGSDSSSSSSSSSGSDSDNEKIQETPLLPGVHPDGFKRPPKRMSAKEAEEQMKVIQSESQRMAREAHVYIPYHKPKSHSLKEFLSRSTIRKPFVRKSLDNRTPAAAIKMNKEELEMYAKQLEERAKEADEFFKCESESEEEGEAKKEEKLTEKPEEENSKEKIEEKMDQKIEEKTLDTQEMEEKFEIQESEEKLDVDTQNLEEIPEQKNDEPEETPKEPEPEPPKVDLKELKKQRILALYGELPKLNIPNFDNQMEIDLESGEVSTPKLSGTDLLRHKYTENACKQSFSQSQEEVKILSMDNGFHVETIKLKKEGKSIKFKDAKPGQPLLKLKEHLEKQIKEARIKEYQKKDEYNKKLEAEYAEYSCDESDVEMEAEGGEEKEGYEENIEAEEIETIEQEDPQEEEEGEEEDDDDSSSSSSDDEEIIQIEKPKKSRIIAAFENSDDDESELPKKVLEEKKEGVNGTEEFDGNSSKLWEATQVATEDDILALCSGKFEPTQKTQGNLNISGFELGDNKEGMEALFSENQTQLELDDMSELCSGRFETQVEKKVEAPPAEEPPITESPAKVEIHPILRRPVILSSDEEKEAETNPEESIKKVKKRKKKRPVLNISDDEESEELSEVEHEEEEEILDEVEEEIPDEPETFIDYDSEENEIEVQMTKADRKKQAKNFMEAEAELSGSEYGSADEDEKDLDGFEKELGDEDQFDQAQLRNELDRIHAIRTRDQDAREVKILQEMFFEDEENDGVGRTRKFMWKNVNMEFNLENNVEGDDGFVHHSDDETEEEWRKMRHEREQILLKQKQEMEMSKEQLDPNEVTTPEGAAIGSKKRIIVLKSSTIRKEAAKEVVSPFLISFDQKLKESRDSFIARGEEALIKLATVVKEPELGATTALGKGRNFVFSTMSPPVEEIKAGKKRQSDGTTDGNQNTKKPRIETNNRKKCLLDSLI